MENSIEPRDILIDPFARPVSYLRISVTDRCDFRCVYCMSENMTFLPKQDLLTLEELDRLCTAFIGRGVRKVRISGGEPLVRKNIILLFQRLGRHLESGVLDELTLTTNGSQLRRHAKALYDAGVRRVNVSLDTLRPDLFKSITRWGALDKVLDGINAAVDEGLAIKINTVALKGVNEDELIDMIGWSHRQGYDHTLIETMPLGEIEQDRVDQYLPLSQVRQTLEAQWDLTPLAYKTGGPARYYQIEQTGGRLGLITPLSHNFCESCNRVRLTCTGMLYMCLGQDDHADLRQVMRDHPEDDNALHDAITHAIGRKPKGHDFVIDRKGQAPAVGRHMSVTGG